MSYRELEIGQPYGLQGLGCAECGGTCGMGCYRGLGASGSGAVAVGAQQRAARAAAEQQIAVGALAGAAAGAAAGSSVVPGIGTVIGAAVGAIAGSVAGLIALSNAHGTSHAQRMTEFNGAIQDALQVADLQDVATDLQTAANELTAYENMSASASSISDPKVQAAYAKASEADDALAKVGDTLTADVATYTHGAAQISPWDVNTPAQLALERIGPEHRDLVQATGEAHSANAALASVLLLAGGAA